tara:strand:- start:6752 stop:7366 length:615 start_codon:yes stop_codon:yes gene_type:complete
MKTSKNNKKRNVKTIKLKNSKKKIYSKNDFKSGDGMLTSVWGPSMWHYLHTMSFNYPVNPSKSDKNHYKKFILSLQHVLPCKYCRINLKNNFKILPLTNNDMENRDKFSRYIYNLHETVNKMLGKQSGLSYCDVRERYEHFRSRCTIDKPKLLIKKHVNKTKKKKESGCTEPLYGKKSKCILKIVPQEKKEKTFQMDKKCIKVR